MDMIPYQDWIDKILKAVPGVQNGVPNPSMLTNSAKLAWQKYNAAAKHADFLRSYYGSKDVKDSCGRKYWRPIGVAFFENLPDVFNNHALRWFGLSSVRKHTDGEEPSIEAQIALFYLTCCRFFDRGKQPDGRYSYSKGQYDICSLIRDFMEYFESDEVKGDWRDKAHWQRIAYQYAYAFTANYKLKW